jgi:hypothetical protein
MMRKLGEQWVEKGSDGKMHMYKCIPEALCDLCAFKIGEYQQHGGIVCKHEKCVTAQGRVKDLGILNEDGCLPAPWDKTFYPNIYEGLLLIYTSDRPVLVCCEDDDISMFAKGKTKQETIDAWNRRV